MGKTEVKEAQPLAEPYRKKIGRVITKVGVPQLKDPIRAEVAEMVKLLAEEAAARSTTENNPDRYLQVSSFGNDKSNETAQQLILRMLADQVVRTEIKNFK